MISVIVPIYNEEITLLKNDFDYQILSQAVELIFVDGGSEDRTVTVARKFGKVLRTRKNRAMQMNAGAQAARHDIILFLHADSVVHQQSLAKIEESVKLKRYVGGCLSQVLDDPSFIYKWIAWTGNIRAKVSKVFYGDQAIFVRKDIFQQLGGFPGVKIGEDVLFTKKLRRKGRVGILPYTVHCSARRWKRQGIWRTFLLHLRINTALIWNQNLDQLANAYQNVRENIKSNNPIKSSPAQAGQACLPAGREERDDA